MDRKSVLPTPVEPLEPLQRAEVTVPAGAAPAAGSLWLRPAPGTGSALGRGWRVALSGLLTGRPASGRARGHGGGGGGGDRPGTLGLQRPRCAVARALGREGRGAGRGGRDGPEGRRADGIPLLCLRVGWIRWGMPSRKCSAKP